MSLKHVQGKPRVVAGVGKGGGGGGEDGTLFPQTSSPKSVSSEELYNRAEKRSSRFYLKKLTSVLREKRSILVTSFRSRAFLKNKLY